MKYAKFLEELSKNRNKEIFCKIIFLDSNDNPLKISTGVVTGGNINIDGDSSVRRSCNISFQSEDQGLIGYKWIIHSKVKIELGLTNNVDKNFPDIIWFPQGVYVLTDYSLSQTTSGISVSLQGKDKMCFLNGDCGGVYTGLTTDQGTEQHLDGTIVDLSIKEIIRQSVHLQGKEAYNNIIIENLDDAKTIVKYKGEDPLYFYQNLQTGKWFKLPDPSMTQKESFVISNFEDLNYYKKQSYYSNLVKSGKYFSTLTNPVKNSVIPLRKISELNTCGILNFQNSDNLLLNYELDEDFIEKFQGFLPDSFEKDFEDFSDYLANFLTAILEVLVAVSANEILNTIMITYDTIILDFLQEFFKQVFNPKKNDCVQSYQTYFDNVNQIFQRFQGQVFDLSTIKQAKEDLASFEEVLKAEVSDALTGIPENFYEYFYRGEVFDKQFDEISSPTEEKFINSTSEWYVKAEKNSDFIGIAANNYYIIQSFELENDTDAPYYTTNEDNAYKFYKLNLDDSTYYKEYSFNNSILTKIQPNYTSSIFTRNFSTGFVKGEQPYLDALFEQINEYIKYCFFSLKGLVEEVKKINNSFFDSLFYNFSSIIKEEKAGVIQLVTDLNSLKGYDVRLIEIKENDIAGYQTNELIYNSGGDALTVNTGETVDSVLTKIKNKLQNFEYFYDLDGKFRFQQKPTFLNQIFSKISYDENGQGYYDNFKQQYSYVFDDLSFFSSISTNPLISNLKNDLTVWGEREGVSGLKIPIHSRFSVNKKPDSYRALPIYKFDMTEKIAYKIVKIYKRSEDGYKFYINKNDTAEYVKLSDIDQSFTNDDLQKNYIYLNSSGVFYTYNKLEKEYQPLFPVFNDLDNYKDELYVKVIEYYITQEVDWREVLYQMSFDWKKNGTKEAYLDNFIFYNPDLNLNIYSEYYTDIFEFWRDLYSPPLEFLMDKILVYNEEADFYRDLKQLSLNFDSEIIFESNNNFAWSGQGLTGFTGWNESIIQDNNTINFWLDFLDNSGELSENFSVQQIGSRSKALNDQSNSKAIKLQEIPLICFYEGELKEQSGYSFIKIDQVEKLFSPAVYGKDCQTKLEEEIYTNLLSKDTLSIQSIPIYYLQPNTLIKIDCKESPQYNGDYVVTKISYNLNYNGLMSLTLIKNQRFLK